MTDLAGSMSGNFGFSETKVKRKFRIFRIASFRPIRKMAYMEIREIERALGKPGKTRSGLAKALGRNPSAVTDLLQGKRQLKASEIPKVARYLEMEPVVPIVGSVGAGAEAHFYAEGQATADTAPAPKGGSPDTVAVEIRGDSLGPGLNGWLAFYDDRRSPITDDLIGRLCVVGLDDGRILIKTPRRARSRGRFHLLPNAGGDTISDAKIVWAARVTGMAPRT